MLYESKLSVPDPQVDRKQVPNPQVDRLTMTHIFGNALYKPFPSTVFE